MKLLIKQPAQQELTGAEHALLMILLMGAMRLSFNNTSTYYTSVESVTFLVVDEEDKGDFSV